MRVYDLIYKKRQGKELAKEEIEFLIDGYTKDEIPDYQMSAFLMSVYFQGMSDLELAYLTEAMSKSGDWIDLSSIQGIKVDKHSTGGVGDKTTLIIAPIVAACGVKVAKMSGKGLGHTGGTIDKLESIPGFCTSIPNEEFFNKVSQIGLCVVGQTGNLAPADKKIYALRDTTATVDSIPLIASSIMSKKLAAGSDAILLDVKMGSGAFMKTMDEACELADKMIAIGRHHNRKMAALITNMDVPLGNAIGNSLEVIEAVNVLKGKGPKDLTKICVELATYMLYIAGIGELEECREKVLHVLEDKRAYSKFLEMVKAQHGEVSFIENTELFPKAKYHYDILSQEEGYIVKMDSQACGIASVLLGAGRKDKESKLDYTAGIILHKKTGDYCKCGERIITLYSNQECLFGNAKDTLLNGIEYGKDKPNPIPLVIKQIL